MGDGFKSFARMIDEAIGGYIATHQQANKEYLLYAAEAAHLMRKIWRPELPPPVPLEEPGPAEEVSE